MTSKKTLFIKSHPFIFSSLTIIVFLILSALSAFYLANVEIKKNNETIKEDVKHQLDKIISDVAKGVGVYQYGLQSLKSAIETVGINNFTYQHHLEYFKGWDYSTAFPGARGFGLIKSIEKENLPFFLSQAKAERQGNFELKQLDAPSDPLFIIQYIEPEINNFAAVGLDIGSEKTRRTAAIKAAKSGHTQLTGPITLVQENSKVKHGFLLLMPIYEQKNGNLLEKPIIGWSYAPLLIGEILANVANLNADFHFKIADISSTETINFYSNYKKKPLLAEFTTEASFQLFGRTWQVKVTPDQSYIDSLNLFNFNELFIIITITVFCFLSIIVLVIFAISNRLKNLNEKKALASMVNNLEDGIISVDRNFTLLTLNRAAADLFNLNFTNNKPIIDYLSPYLSSETLISIFKKVARGETVNNMTLTISPPNESASKRDLLLSISPTFQQDQFYGATFSLSDITQIKALQSQLEEHNDELKTQVAQRTQEIQATQELQRSVLNSNNMAVIATDEKGRINLINNEAEKLIGCSEKSILGKTLVEKFLPCINQGNAIIHNGACETITNQQVIDFIKEQSEKLEAFTLINEVGEKSQINISVSSIPHTQGFLFTLTDVTETLSLKKELTLISEALNNSQDILLWCDINGNIKYANPFASVVLGYTPNLFLSLNIHQIINFEQHEPWSDVSQKVLMNQKYSFEIPFIDANKKQIPTLVSLNKLQIANENFIFLAAKDISYQKDQASQLNTALSNADIANETKVLFLSNISHELRTPLHAINGMIQLLQSTELNNKQLSYIQSAKRNVTTLSTMMDDILEITQSERGALTLNEECFNFNELMNKLSEHLILISEKKNIEINFEIPPKTPSYLITDPNKLLKILLSLTENAVKFTEKGLITVKFKIEETSNKAAKLFVEVKDTGIGINKEKLTSIFNLFNQNDSALNRQYGGIGMGLALAREFIKLMNGDITVESTVGVGTTIKLSVDVQVEHQPEENAELLKTLSDLNVLIVDDNPTSLQILSDIVSNLGCYTTITDSPENALTLFESAIKHNEIFDVALIDWKMPNINGWELAEKMRAIDTNNQMPLVVMVTAHTKQMFAQKQDDDISILNGFVTKPVTKHVLIDALLDTISAKSTHHLEHSSIIDKNTPLFNKRILVVEDNPSNQEVAKSLLESLGATVILCSGGYKALFELENSLLKFDLVLMDIQMPDMDGYETTKRIKAMKKFQQLPIIAMTAYVKESEKAKCFEAGMVGHISKPYEVNNLIAQILKATETNELHSKSISKQVNTPDNNTETALNSTSEQEPHYLSPEIIEFCDKNKIEIMESIERFSYLTDIYVRSLNLFHDELINYSEQLSAEKDSLIQQDFIRLFHTLKSTSASLGFTELSLCANSIDKNYACTPNYAHTDEENLLVLKLINHTLTLISQLEALFLMDKKEIGIPVKEFNNFSELFNTLVTEVNNFNMHALEVFEEISPNLTVYSKSKTEALAAYLNKLKFKEASKILIQIKGIIEKNEKKEASCQ